MFPGLRSRSLFRLKHIFQGRFFDVQLAIVLALTVLFLRGIPGEGQASIFHSVVRGYIEETPASISRLVRAYNQPSDINTLVQFQPLSLAGQGGQAANSLDFSTIQQSSVVAYSPTAKDYIESNGFKRNNVVEYTVQAGDTLSFVASDYGITMNSLLWANKLKDSDSLQPGQILRIPPVSGVIHTVKIGDTVASLAKKYGTDEAKIIAFNSLSQDGQLQTDDEITIPDGTIQPVKLVSTVAAAKSKTVNKLFSYLPDLGAYFRVPTTGYNWNKLHGRNGVDIANSCGTEIYSTASGIVTTAQGTGWNGGFGKFIKLEHPNGTESIYAHLSKLMVANGNYVEKGQLIGLMGTTGRSTGCHLHFEVHGAKNPLAHY